MCISIPLNDSWLFSARQMNGGDDFEFISICQDLISLCTCAVHYTKMAARSKRSKVWLNFTKVNANLSKCNTCGKQILSKGGTTTSIRKHLLLHGVNLKECTVFNSPSASGESMDNEPEAASSSSTSISVGHSG